MKVSVLGTGNVGVAIAADLSIGGHDVSLIKTSLNKSETYDRLVSSKGLCALKEDGKYTWSKIRSVGSDLSKVCESDVVFVTIQSTYHENLIRRLVDYITEDQIVVVICSYLSLGYFRKYSARELKVVETTGPYLEGRVELDDEHSEVAFRVGCRLSRSPLSVSPSWAIPDVMKKLRELYKGFSCDYTEVESGLLNPNMVLHTIGSIMSLPRIEFSDGDFCMYREAYSRKNDTTMRMMLALDEEKKSVLKKLGLKPVDIFDAGGFLGDKMKSFYAYSESSDRAKSPTSIHSRYITEDVSQGLVLLESFGQAVGVFTTVATSLINMASVALEYDFRKHGRTIEKLGLSGYVRFLKCKNDASRE